MQGCKDLGLPKLNADSSEHYQQYYYDEELLLDKLEKLQGKTGMAGQLLPDYSHASSH